MTNVTLVGTVGKASSASGSVTAAYGQTPTANNILVAVISAGDLFAETANISTSTTGWSRLRGSTLGDGNSYVMTDAWAKTAAGGDAAPVFTQTLDAGSDPEMTCYMFELNSANLSSPLDTSGTYQQSSGSGTALFSVSSSAHVAAAGEFAITIFVQMRSSSSSLTWTETGSGWTSAGKLPAGSAFVSTQCNYQANPTSGATLSDAGHFSTDSSAIACGLMIVVAVQPAVPINITGVAAAITLAGGVGSPHGEANAQGSAAVVTMAGGVGAVTADVKVNILGVAAHVVIDGVGGLVRTSPAAIVAGVAAEIVIDGSSGSFPWVNIYGSAAPINLAVGAGWVYIPIPPVYSRVTWDDQGRYYSAGVSNGMLYPRNSPGVPWNGLVSVTEKGDAPSTAYYIDGQLCRNHIVPDSFSATIVAYTYPDEFEPYAGVVQIMTGQPKQLFGFSYRTNREIHLVWNALAEPSQDQYASISDSIVPVSFSWDVTTIPKNIPGGRPSAHLVIMLDFAYADAIAALEDIIYGDDSNAPSLPDPSVILALFESYAVLQITDNGDGTWTAYTAEDYVIIELDTNTFQITWPSAIITGTDTFTITSQ